MVWRTSRSRISGMPLLLLLITTGLGFLAGLLSSVFFWECFQLGYVISPGPNRSEDLASSLSLLSADFINFKENCSAWEEVPAKDVRALVLDRIFDGTSPFDDFPSPEIGPLLRKKRIKGWGADGSVFERLMGEVRPALVLELGSFLGASAIHIGQIARNLSLESTILCVDDFRGWPGFRADKFQDIKLQNGENMLYHQFLKNVQFMNLTECIVPVPFSIAGVLLKFCEWGVRPDLIEVDAGHDFHSVWQDLNLASAILKPGGVMFGHDYFTRGSAEGVRRAVDLFAKLKDLTVEPDGQHWILRNRAFASSNLTVDSL